MKIGYARTSTVEQKAGFEAQIDALKAAGCEQDHIFSEQVSSVGERKELEAAIRHIRKGETLVVTKLDRLARSVADLMDILRSLEAKGAGLSILDLNLDTQTTTGKLMVSILGAIAQFEREMMLERQREGIAKAKAQGKYKGRTPTARAQAEAIQALAADGVGPTLIAKQLGIGRASVYRVLKDLG